MLKTSYYDQHYAHRQGPHILDTTDHLRESIFSDLKNSFKKSQIQSLEDNVTETNFILFYCQKIPHYAHKYINLLA